MSELSHLVRTLRCPSDLERHHIRAHNNQRHVLLQRHACKGVRLEREASGLHNSWNYFLYSETAAETISEGLKSKIFLGAFP